MEEEKEVFDLDRRLAEIREQGTKRIDLLSRHASPVQCLDHGHVRIVDVMGDDAAIVQAARVSYGKGTKTVREDRGLIRYLVRHRHTSPLEMCEIKLHVKLPIFVARQWIRHRTAKINEISGRYSILDDEFYIPNGLNVLAQAKDNKQGRGDALPRDVVDKFLALTAGNAAETYNEYETSAADGVARELARINLPLNLYTSWYWKVDLHNLLHFLKLRMDPHAQYEIRVYADAIAKFVEAWVPFAWEAFEEYVLGAHTVSRAEMEILRGLVKSASTDGRIGKLLPEGYSDRERKAFSESFFGHSNEK